MGFNSAFKGLKYKTLLYIYVHFVGFVTVSNCSVHRHGLLKVHTEIFFVIKPTRCTNFTNLFCHETLHVSDSSSVHHQEIIHCTLSNVLCHTGL